MGNPSAVPFAQLQSWHEQHLIEWCGLLQHGLVHTDIMTGERLMCMLTRHGLTGSSSRLRMMGYRPWLGQGRGSASVLDRSLTTPPCQGCIRPTADVGLDIVRACGRRLRVLLKRLLYV